MHDFMAHVHGGTVPLQCAIDDLDRADDTRTKAAGLSKDDSHVWRTPTESGYRAAGIEPRDRPDSNIIKNAGVIAGKPTQTRILTLSGRERFLTGPTSVARMQVGPSEAGGILGHASQPISRRAATLVSFACFVTVSLRSLRLRFIFFLFPFNFIHRMAGRMFSAHFSYRLPGCGPFDAAETNRGRA
jgi:hypothetical protein